MVTITFPSDTKDTIDAIREAIGRDATFYTIATTSGCSTCSLDPINNTSTDPFCVTCGGVYWFIIYSGHVLNSHVRWAPFEEPKFTTAGIVHEGDCTVTVEYTGSILNIVDTTKYVLVDGVRMLIHRYSLRGKPEINRIRILLKEEG